MEFPENRAGALILAGEHPEEIRLKLAARLLEQGNYNISEVAYAVGFSNPNYFSTCFSELYSMSPKEYMK